MKHLTIEEVISRLESRDYTVKKSGGVYRSQCPAHDGEDLNLAFSEGNKGQVVFTCHSHQCSYEEIMASLGIEKEQHNARHPLRKTKTNKTIHPTFEKAVSAAAFGVGQNRAPDTVHRYKNLSGTYDLAFCRWDTPNGKFMRPVQKVDGGYIVGEENDGTSKPIYRLPETTKYLKSCGKTARIFVCEGEKAAAAAALIGLHATTSAFGSKSASKTDWAVLDRLATEHNVKLELVILPDNDKPGEEYAETLVDIFTNFKSNPIVKVVPLASFGHITGIAKFPQSGDFYDLLEILDTKECDDILNMVERMVNETMPEVEVVEDNLDTVYPWRPFPVDLLPETVSRFIAEVSNANGCDPAGVAIATLVVLATAIGNSRRLRLKRGWTFPAILWGMLIARKGAIKSWAMSPAIKPLNQKQDEYHQRHKLDKAEHRRQKSEYDNMTPAQKRSATPFDAEEPTIKRIVSHEATEQKIVKNCAENPRGFGIFSDELTTLLKGMGQYCKDSKGGNAQSIFNSLFNGEGIESERIGESRCAPHAFVCILGGIQPGLARKCFDQEAFESGFASRFIPVAPPLRVATWSDAVVSEETEEAYCRLIYAVLALEMEAVWGAANVEVSEWNPDGGNMISVTGVPSEPESMKPILIETSPEALAIYKEFYDRTAQEMLALEDDNIRGAFEKMRTYAARLALVIHVTRAVEQELFLKQNRDPNLAPWDRSEPRIDELECDVESMRIGVALADWFKYEVRRVYNTWGGLTDETPKPKTDGLQQRIVEFLEMKREGVTIRDLKRRFKGESDSLEAMLNTMTSQGVITRIEQPKNGPGRPREIYRIMSVC